jgi:predicted ester cyclase
MTSDEVRRFLDRFAKAWEEGDLVTLADCYADNCEVVSPIFHTLHGLPQVEHSFRTAFKAFAAQTLRVDEVVIDSENPGRAALVWTSKVKHQGEIFGIPATGKIFDVTMSLILTLVDGKVLREVRVYDFTNMLMQIGVFRAKAQSEGGV